MRFAGAVAGHNLASLRRQPGGWLRKQRLREEPKDLHPRLARDGPRSHELKLARYLRFLFLSPYHLPLAIFLELNGITGDFVG